MSQDSEIIWNFHKLPDTEEKLKICEDYVTGELQPADFFLKAHRYYMKIKSGGTQMFDFGKVEKQFELGTTYRLEFTNIELEYPITSINLNIIQQFVQKLVKDTNFIQVNGRCWEDCTFVGRYLECPRIEIIEEDSFIIGFNSDHYGDC